MLDCSVTAIALMSCVHWTPSIVFLISQIPPNKICLNPPFFMFFFPLPLRSEKLYPSQTRFAGTNLCIDRESFCKTYGTSSGDLWESAGSTGGRIPPLGVVFTTQVLQMPSSPSCQFRTSWTSTHGTPALRAVWCLATKRCGEKRGPTFRAGDDELLESERNMTSNVTTSFWVGNKSHTTLP